MSDEELTAHLEKSLQEIETIFQDRVQMITVTLGSVDPLTVEDRTGAPVLLPLIQSKIQILSSLVLLRHNSLS